MLKVVGFVYKGSVLLLAQLWKSPRGLSEDESLPATFLG